MSDLDLNWTNAWFDTARTRDASPLIKAPSNARVWVALVAEHENHLEILIGRRGPDINKAGHWNLFGGNVDAGEDLVTAAKRELKEETGLVLPDSVYRSMYQAEVHDGKKHCTWFVVHVGELSELRALMNKAEYTAETDMYSIRRASTLLLGSCPLKMHYSLSEFLKLPLCLELP